MYAHLGGGFVVRTRDVVAILEMDNTTSSKITRDFLSAAEARGELQNAAEDIPRSFVVCADGDKQGVVLASPSPAVLARRMR